MAIGTAIQRQNNAYFTTAASTWDTRVDMDHASGSAFQAIIERFPKLLEAQPVKRSSNEAPDLVVHHLRQGPDVLEIGCGTGLLSLRMSPFVRLLVAIDACDSMIQELNKKIKTAKQQSNILPLSMMLSSPDDMLLPAADENDLKGPRKRFDLALSHLTMHHVGDLRNFLETILGCLKPGGWVALTDFEDFGREAELFHPKARSVGVVRHGLRRDDMRELMVEVGFVNVSVEVGWIARKEVERWPGEWGQEKPTTLIAEERDFPFLICTGSRCQSARGVDRH